MQKFPFPVFAGLANDAKTIMCQKYLSNGIIFRQMPSASGGPVAQ